VVTIATGFVVERQVTLAQSGSTSKSKNTPVMQTLVAPGEKSREKQLLKEPALNMNHPQPKLQSPSN